jgi:hypothetical protein
MDLGGQWDAFSRLDSRLQGIAEAALVSFQGGCRCYEA